MKPEGGTSRTWSQALILALVALWLLVGPPRSGADEPAGAPIRPENEGHEPPASGVPASEEAAVHYREAVEHSRANDPVGALGEIDRAVDLEPDNVEYLHTRARFANWAGKYDVAVDSYERLIALDAGGAEVMLGLARSRSWGGDLSGAASAYRAYVEVQPDDAGALVEYARVKAWSGDYAGSLEALEHYRTRHGESSEYKKEKARVLAWAARPNAALAVLDSLPPEEQEEYGVVYTRTIALHQRQQPEEALESLAAAESLCPECPELADLHIFVNTPLRSFARGGAGLYLDSDDLSQLHVELQGVRVHTPGTRIVAELETDFLKADRGSGLENRDGSEDARHVQALLAAEHRFSPRLAGRAGLGVSSAEDRWKVPVYDLSLELRPRDGLKLDISREYGYYVLSPRTLSLRIKRGLNRALVQWAPALRYTVVSSLGLDTFSDDNTRWEVVVAPRRAFVRSNRLILDLGLNATWFGFEDDLDNGYYDPDLYQRYTVTAFGYWKLSDDAGVSFALAAGLQKDEDMDHARFGWSADVKGTFGIFADWMFEIRGAVMENVRQTAGAFRGYRIEGFVTRRFGSPVR